MSAKADDYDTVSQSVEKASGFVGGLWITFISVGAYLAVAAASVTQVQLFHETPIKLPLLDASLPLVAFFWFMPCFFTVMHFYLLMQTYILSDKIRRLNEVLSNAGLDADIRYKIRQLLPNDLLVQSLAGPLERRQGFTGQMFRAVAWLTMVGGPAAILLLFQYKFLPFQSERVTWTHRMVLAADLACLWLWWLPASVPLRPNRRAPRLGTILRTGFVTAAVLATSLVALTFPGERLDGLEPQQTFHTLFASRIPDDDLTPQQVAARDAEPALRRLVERLMPPLSSRDRELAWFRNVPEARRLVAGNLRLPEADLVNAKELDDRDRTTESAEATWESARSESFAPRNFVAANFYRADLRRMDFQDSRFDRANMIYARLDGVTLKRASLVGTLMDYARLNGASLDKANLARASLGLAELERGSLDHADLRGAWLFKTNLQGAVLNFAHLEGASMDGVLLQGARLEQAFMHGSSLQGAQLQGARLDGALLIGASLAEADLDGAGLDGAELEGVDLQGAKLRGALIDHARLQGARLLGADLQGASMSGAYVFRASRDANVSDLRADDLEKDGVFPVIYKKNLPIDEDVVKSWIAAATAYVTDQERSAAIERRLQAIASVASIQESSEGGKYWSMVERNSPDLVRHQSRIGELLLTAMCGKNFSKYGARGLLQSARPEQLGRMGSAGPFFFGVAELISASHKDNTMCASTAGFGAKDRERLDFLLDHLPRPSREVVRQELCTFGIGASIARGILVNQTEIALAPNPGAGEQGEAPCGALARMNDADVRTLARLVPGFEVSKGGTETGH